MNIHIKNAFICTIDEGNDSCVSGSLLTEGNRIAYVGHGRDMPKIHVDREIDGKGKLILPGFANAHTHLPMTLFRGSADDMTLQDWLFKAIFPMEDKLNGELCYWGSLLAIAEMLRGGVTLVNDMYFFMEDVARAAADSGIRALLSRGLSDTGGGEKGIRENISLYDEYNGAADGRVTVGFGPHAEYTCSPGYIRKITDIANERGCRLHIHVSETEQEHQECIERHGMTPVALLDSLGALGNTSMLAHCVMVTDEDIELISMRGASVLHCPGSNLKLASGFAPLNKLLNAGVNVGLGTDGAASNNNLSLWEEMSLAALIHKGKTGDPTVIKTAEALNMASRGGYKAAGIEDGGMLKKGCAADFMLVDMNKPHYYPLSNIPRHIVYSGQGSDVFLTCVNGEVVYEDGKYKCFDIGEVCERVTRLVKDVYGITPDMNV